MKRLEMNPSLWIIFASSEDCWVLLDCQCLKSSCWGRKIFFPLLGNQFAGYIYFLKNFKKIRALKRRFWCSTPSNPSPLVTFHQEISLALPSVMCRELVMLHAPAFLPLKTTLMKGVHGRIDSAEGVLLRCFVIWIFWSGSLMFCISLGF